MCRMSLDAPSPVSRKLPVTVATAGLASVCRLTYGCAADHGGAAAPPWPALASAVTRAISCGSRRRSAPATSSCAGSASQASCSSSVYARAHLAPVVDRAGRARRDAGVARVALRGVDDVVARVVRDRVDRARLLARVAANADLGVDEVLADSGPDAAWSASRSSPWTAVSEPHVLEVDRLLVDAHRRRRDPVRELARLDDAAHERGDERAVLGGRQPRRARAPSTRPRSRRARPATRARWRTCRSCG